jgi:broad specificity phosphatase PhoE
MDDLRTLWLIRHAESVYNAMPPELARIGGRSDHLKLTSRGKRQAQALGRHLARLRESGVHFASNAFTSPSERAMRTAELALSQFTGMPRISDDRLTERGMGAWEGKLVQECYTPQVRKALDEDLEHWRCPGGESYADVGRRMRDALGSIVQHTKPGEVALVFTHGLAIRCALAELLESGWRGVQRNRNDNTGITELHVHLPTGQWSCGRINDAAHLETLERA